MRIAVHALTACAAFHSHAPRNRPVTLAGLLLVSADGIARHCLGCDARLGKCYVHISPVCADLNWQMNWRTKPAPAKCGNPCLRTASHLSMKRSGWQWGDPAAWARHVGLAARGKGVGKSSCGLACWQRCAISCSSSILMYVMPPSQACCRACRPIRHQRTPLAGTQRSWGNSGNTRQSGRKVCCHADSGCTFGERVGRQCILRG